ncbi:MAG: aminotransferase class V-fold PLP-dependent enzyme, partial [Spirochaetales bacterium]|nr:aminotransferase class V-fold PLP-dependent enzyme [Spirochaetales bacterium]
MDRVFNFNPGPSTLPVEALEKAAKDLVNYQGSGMSIMEHSHRGKEYEAVHNGAIALIKELYKVPDNFDILFIQGGASLQFAMIPMCFLRDGKKVLYVNSGTWSKKAIKEAKIQGKNIEVIATSEDTNFDRIP